MSDDKNIIYDILKELKTEFKEQRNEFKEHRSEFKDHSIENHTRLTSIEVDLRDHKEGVIQNRKRISELEEPRKALSQIKKWATWIAAVGGATVVFSKFMRWF